LSRTVGVIGTGAIGAVFCNIMMGFGCKVIAYDVYENEQLKQRGVNYVELEQLLASSDIVSLHVPLLPTTRHLINATTLAKMKRGVMLINVSRGALINTRDVTEALKQGIVGNLGIDVYEREVKRMMMMLLFRSIVILKTLGRVVFSRLV
jgi:D-lactate dehydrogenase